MALPDELPLNDHESVVRYLLLRALLNQQGVTEKVREFARSLFAKTWKRNGICHQMR